jgi:hypothetical protein
LFEVGLELVHYLVRGALRGDGFGGAQQWGEHVVQQDWGADDIDPEVADSVLGVLAQKPVLAEYYLFIQDFLDDISSLILLQPIFSEIVKQQFQPINNLIPIYLEVIWAVLEQVNIVHQQLMHLDKLHLLLHMVLQVFIRSLLPVTFLIILQQNKQELKELNHHSKQLLIEHLSHILIKLLIWSLPQRLDDVADRLTQQLLDFCLVIAIAPDIHIGHQMDKQIGQLIQELQTLVVGQW